MLGTSGNLLSDSLPVISDLKKQASILLEDARQASTLIPDSRDIADKVLTSIGARLERLESDLTSMLKESTSRFDEYLLAQTSRISEYITKDDFEQAKRVWKERTATPESSGLSVDKLGNMKEPIVSTLCTAVHLAIRPIGLDGLDESHRVFYISKAIEMLLRNALDSNSRFGSQEGCIKLQGRLVAWALPQSGTLRGIHRADSPPRAFRKLHELGIKLAILSQVTGLRKKYLKAIGENRLAEVLEWLMEVIQVRNELVHTRSLTPGLSGNRFVLAGFQYDSVGRCITEIQQRAFSIVAVLVRAGRLPS